MSISFSSLGFGGWVSVSSFGLVALCMILRLVVVFLMQVVDEVKKGE